MKMKTILVALSALALGTAGGFAAGSWRSSNPKPEEVRDEKPAAEKPSASGDAARLAKAQKRIAELERDLASARRAATALKAEKLEKVASAQTNKAERVISLDDDGKDVLGKLESQLTHEEFSQVTNAMTQLRARLAEKAKGRMEFLASVNTDGMSADKRANHAKFLKLMEKREAIAAKMKGGFPDAESIQKMVELEVEMAPVAKKARSALVGQVARELGYQGDDVEVVRDTVNTIFDCTSGGGMGGLGDIMESAGGAPGTVVSPEVKVETHVIGL